MNSVIGKWLKFKNMIDKYGTKIIFDHLTSFWDPNFVKELFFQVLINLSISNMEWDYFNFAEMKVQTFSIDNVIFVIFKCF